MRNGCAATQQWLCAAPGSSAAAPTDELVAHVAACPHCCGALALLITYLIAPPPTDTMISCLTCEDALAAFIDNERAFGLAATIRIFPAVWWHLLFCPACGACYDDLRDLLLADPRRDLDGHALLATHP